MNTLSKNGMLLKSGTVINGKWNRRQYIIRRSLGSGENGIVYLVQSSSKQYALKISLAAIDLSYEIQAIQRLNKSQGSCLGFSIFDIDDFIYQGQLYTFYVMPYQTGISIEYYLYGKSGKDFNTVFRKVIEALVLIHREGWVFGDIKPEHILIDPNQKNLSFVDYGGISKLNEGVKQYTELYDRGSWRSGSRKADPHYDLFSIAMVFVQLGIGKHKLHRIFNHNRSLNNVYEIIRKVRALETLAPVLIGILSGKLSSIAEVMEDLELNLQNLKVKKKSLPKNWIDWLFTSSSILFIIMLILFIYHR